MEKSEINWPTMKLLGALLHLILAAPALAASIDSRFNYEGKVFDASTGDAISSSTAVFRIEIWDPTQSCKLYDGSKSYDLSHGNDTSLFGTFSFLVGDGSFNRRAGDPNHNFANVFSNRMSLSGYSACSYSPTASDSRILKIFMDQDGAGASFSEELIASHTVGSAPTASVAESLQGYLPTDFFRKSEFSCGTNEILQYSGTNWVCAALPAGGTGTVTSIGAGTGLVASPGSPITSAGTLSVDVGTGANKIVQLDASGRLPAVDGSQLTGVVTTLPDIVTAGTFSKVTFDAKGRVTAGAALAASDIPSLDAAKITTGSIDDARMPSKLSLSGGTMAGAINMNSQRITNLATPTSSSDGANRSYVDSAVSAAGSAYLPKDGSSAMSGNLDLGANNIENVNLLITDRLHMPSASLVTAAPDMIENDGLTLHYTNSSGMRAPIPWVASPDPGEFLQWSGSEWVTSSAGGGGVISVSADPPLSNSGTAAAPVLDLNYGDGLEVSGGSLIARAGDYVTVNSSGINVFVGNVAGSVMAANAVPSCLSDEKLQMSMGPTYSWSCEPELAEVGDISSVNAGTGLSGGGSSGDVSLSVTYGTSSGTAAQGNDARFGNADRIHGTAISGAAPGANSVLYYNGSQWAPGSVTTALGYTPVNKAGDTLTGTHTFSGSLRVQSSSMSSFIVANGAGTEQARVDGSTGNVGIGTSSPSRKLHIAGGSGPALRIDSSFSSGFELFSGGNTFDPSLRVTSTLSSTQINHDPIDLVPEITLASETVGINKSSPNSLAALDVYGNVHVEGKIRVNPQNIGLSVSCNGTPPTITPWGNDVRGKVYFSGGIVSTACTINFSVPYPGGSVPTCVVSWSGASIPGASIGVTAASSTSITVGFSSGIMTGQFNYMCLD